MTIYFAGGDPEHLLEAYKRAYKQECCYGYVDAEGKLRTPLESGDTVIYVASKNWMPLLHKIAEEHGCKYGFEVFVPETEWTVQLPQQPIEAQK
jgi:hypothetical protein